ncbi:MAG: hypothetical protein GX983_02590, partial [Corynebacterium sp.]|nr:hypothetical protein [Corynebacterium sp.]
PDAFYEAVRVERGEEAAEQWRAAATAREEAGLRRIVAGMHGGVLYERPVERNLGVQAGKAREIEAAVLLDSRARLVDGVLNPTGIEG